MVRDFVCEGHLSNSGVRLLGRRFRLTDGWSPSGSVQERTHGSSRNLLASLCRDSSFPKGFWPSTPRCRRVEPRHGCCRWPRVDDRSQTDPDGLGRTPSKGNRQRHGSNPRGPLSPTSEESPTPLTLHDTPLIWGWGLNSPDPSTGITGPVLSRPLPTSSSWGSGQPSLPVRTGKEKGT